MLAPPSDLSRAEEAAEKATDDQLATFNRRAVSEYKGTRSLKLHFIDVFWPLVGFKILSEQTDLDLNDIVLRFDQPLKLPAVFGAFKQLTSLSAEGPMEGFEEGSLSSSLTRLELEKTALERAPDMSALTELKTLRLAGENLRLLGDLSALRALKELVITGPIEEWPSGLAMLTSLEKLSIRGWKVTNLPAALAQIPLLKTLSVGDMHIDSVDDTLAVRELKVTHRDLSVGAISSAAYAFLGLPSTATLFAHLGRFAEQMREVEAVARVLDAQSGSSDVGLPELHLAVSRTYIDVEHGASSNKFYGSQIHKFGSLPEQAANKALPVRVTDAASAEQAEAILQNVDEIDASVFRELVTAILASEWHTTRKADWF